MKAVLSVCFGTSYADTRERTIDAIDVALRDAFPDRAFYSAWTSTRIVTKVRKRGEHHDTLDEAFARLTEDGVDDVVISTMCLMNGHEMAKAASAAQAWVAAGEGRSVRMASPLLASPEDHREVARIVCEEFAFVADTHALLLMGHGSGDGGDNSVYSAIQDELHRLGRERFFVATVEGVPTFDDVVPLVEACGAQLVYLTPLMIVAGDHANNDLAGDDDDSWAQLLAARGLRTEAVLKGLGEYAGVRQLVCDHALAALATEESAIRG